jgi:cellulose synthase/poly-beta-1,6-N-acetylglucosamine synthase-like glycosyltransferase
MTILSLLALVVLVLPLSYWFFLAVASIGKQSPLTMFEQRPSYHFVIAIPAHNEATVIQDSVRQLQEMNYPANMFSIHIVADHCTDDSAKLAREAGAFVHERREGPRSGKGAALSWLFQWVLDDSCDAVVVFDADTQVDPDFLRVMNIHLANGHQVIQGQHIISNPEQGWFPALTWAMFIVDNRFQNHGRSNIGWSAKNMGDSICFRADVLHKTGWGEGLTEDYQLRQRLLLEGIKITYEPAAKAYGEAPRSWSQVAAQRARWLRGTYDAGQQFARRLLLEGFKRRDMSLLDGAFQAYFPSYSTLTIVSISALLIQVLINWLLGETFLWDLIGIWAAVVGALILYPFIGLALEKAPGKAYLAILLGPAFIIWRTWMALVARYGRQPINWIRTPHGDEVQK